MFGGCRGFPVIFLFPNTLLNGAVGAQGVGGLERDLNVHLLLLSSEVRANERMGEES